jgi:hypothetical protein
MRCWSRPVRPGWRSARGLAYRYTTAWWACAESAALGKPDIATTVLGEHTLVVVQMFDPVLIDLALLAIRSRIKR